MPDNNLIEQDHRSIKLRLSPMLGFKRFRNASNTIAGIELVHRIRKGQFALTRLRVRGKTAPEIWTASVSPANEICTRAVNSTRWRSPQANFNIDCERHPSQVVELNHYYIIMIKCGAPSKTTRTKTG